MRKVQTRRSGSFGVRNKTYREVERRIAHAVVRLCRKTGLFRLVMRAVAREAGVAVSTVYNHCDGLLGLVTGKMRWRVARSKERAGSLEAMFRGVLLECYRGRQATSMMFAVCNLEGVERMVERLGPAIVQWWTKCDVAMRREIFGYCRWLILEEIRVWQREKYDPEQMEKHVRHLAWIVRNVPRFYQGLTAGDGK